MATAEKKCPPNWQEQVIEKRKEFLSKGRGPLFGLILPKAWQSSLRPYMQQLGPLLGVKRITFQGTAVAELIKPVEKDDA